MSLSPMSSRFEESANMDSITATRTCSICSATVPRLLKIVAMKWQSNFHIVYVNEGHVDIGSFHWDIGGPKQKPTSIVSGRPMRPILSLPGDDPAAYLIHTSCYSLLSEFARTAISPLNLFKICQTLRPDGSGRFQTPGSTNPDVETVPRDCPDPYALVGPQKCLLGSDNSMLLWRPDTANEVDSPSLFNLPAEILVAILQNLSPSDLIRFFRTSKQALSYADLFCRSSPVHFHRCSTNATGSEEDKRILMLALSAWDQYPILDARQSIASKADGLAQLLPLLSGDILTSISDPRTSLTSTYHTSALWEDYLSIPDDAHVMEVCSIVLDGKRYICGIGFNDTQGTGVFMGNRGQPCHTIKIADATAETIFFAADALGARNVKYGTTPWIFDDTTNPDAWEGISIRRGERELRIIRDPLKIRQIGWHNPDPPQFAETVLMSPKHPSTCEQGSIAEEQVVHGSDSGYVTDMISTYGHFTTESVFFGQDLQKLTIYSDRRFTRVQGMAFQTSSKTQYLGACDERLPSRSIALNAPNETLTEIRALTGEDIIGLALKFRTSEYRILSSLSKRPTQSMRTGKSLEPPPGRRITGLYARFGWREICSLGIIYD